VAVTRSWEAAEALTGPRLRALKPPVPAVRRLELRLLLAASVLVAAALLLVLRARTEEFDSVGARLAKGTLVNLNSVREASELQHWMDAATAQQVLDRERPLPNVGALRSVLRDRLPSVKPFLIVRRPMEYLWSIALWAGIYFAAFYGVHLGWRWRRFSGDGAILPAVHLLTGIGMTIALSLRDPLRDTLEFRKFSMGVALGCGLLLLPLLRVFDYRRYATMIYTPLIAAFVLFAALALFGSGPTGNDSRINLGPVQPVELIKVLLVLYFAGYFARRWEWLRELRERRLPRLLNLPRFSHTLPVLAGTAAALLLFFALKDLGPALVIASVFLAMYGVARARAGLALAGIVLVIAGVAAGYRLGQPRTVAGRISMWLSPWDNDVRGGDQLVHATWAFATGGPFGSGPGRGDPAMIPAGHTDLVLPAFAEEWGIPGVFLIAALMGFLFHRSTRIALAAPDEFGVFLGLGLSTLLAIEMLLISAGVLGAIPLTGVVSPFLSSGNSAMLMNFLVLALIIGISARTAPAMPAAQPFRTPVRVLSLLLGIATAGLLAKAVSVQALHDDELLARDVQVFQADGVKRPQHNPRLNSLAQSLRRGTIYDRNGVVLAESVDGLRRYPFPRETAHLVGNARTRENFAASNSSLIEDDQNAVLRGYSGYAELAALVRYRHQPGHPGIAALQARDRDVHTTLDIRLQERVTQALERGLRARGAHAGAAVVIDASSGEVLALASAPVSSPERPSLPDELLDRARYGLYPPGSAFKLVTALAAMRKDPTLAHARYRCASLGHGRVGASIPGWNRPVRDDAGDPAHGTPDMARALSVSCNAYFAQLGVFGAGSRTLLDTARLLGLPVENTEEWSRMLPFSAMGQGPVVISPFQMARVSAAIASGGLAPQGRWLLGSANTRTEPPVRIVDHDQAQFLAAAMRSVVTQGTARSAMSGLHVQVAGKTGTAQTEGEPHSWFTGFAPFDLPEGRIAFAVVVEHGGYGARAAGPIAKEIVAAARDLGVIAKR
jgi:cell division protein FtsI/penicillin-binding protein 2/cell division protein FtsW (lipid II flippase)